MKSHPSTSALSGEGKGSVRQEGNLKSVQPISSLNHQGHGCREYPRVLPAPQAGHSHCDFVSLTAPSQCFHGISASTVRDKLPLS